ncbi:PREDICTED: arrestin domain-containing protein 3-like isoform X2 [Priapulus caudatus]|uniref:Arrestin domain-containing protein 3-like isoform X2 n=1 Tax=Priapulus caudatus TaxID=37621 RepID=A0ABM1E003_PRICU|nr:PREDICTED: arrestin domain-containing protein 3-like isoform X2 [Priapulus caudatus]
MGKLKAFQILFYNTQPVPVYYAGQVLSGQVIVELNEPMSMRGLRLILNGAAKVHWIEHRSSGSGKHKHTHIVHYNNDELYFNHEIILFTKEPGSSDNPMMPAGRNAFDFAIRLPPQIPSTFEGLHGGVRYYAKACINRPWKFDHTVKEMFTVVSVLDLNVLPQAESHVSGRNEKYVCCWCCKQGPLACEASIPRMGYVPGENILVSAEIENNTNRKCNDSKAKLTVITTFSARSKTRSVSKVIGFISKGEIKRREGETWTNEPLRVPPLPPSKLVGCNIIDIDYFVDVEVSPAGPALDLDVRLPIIIGSIPLRSVFQGWQAQDQIPFSNALQSQENHRSVPPSYMECMDSNVDARDSNDDAYTMGDLKYTPCYPYYNNLQ